MTATLASFKRSVKTGTTMLCVENTYRPMLNGQERTVIKTGTVGFKWVGEGDGRESHTPWPLARNVESVSDSEITFRLFPGMEGKDHHTVTLRIAG